MTLQILIAATLLQNCAAVTNAAAAIDAAITAKGGTLVAGGKLANAAAGIASIPTGSTGPTLDQFCQNQLEEVTIQAGVTTYIPLVFRSLTNLRRIEFLDYGVKQLSFYAQPFNGMSKLECVKCPIALSGDGFQACTMLREAWVYSITPGTFTFWSTGSNASVVTVDIHVLSQDAATLLARINAVAAQNNWQKPKLVFHGNDGNKVAWNGSEWVISDE